MTDPSRRTTLRRVAIGAALAVAGIGLLALHVSRYFSGSEFADTPWTARPSSVVMDLQAALDHEMAANPQSHGMLLHVQAPALSLDRSFAAGSAGDGPMRPEHVVRIASNTKTHVSAATLRLVERGSLVLTGSIRPLLSEKTIAALTRDGYDVDAIQLRHLLSHTAGIPDYGEHPAYMFDSIWRDLLHCRRSWTREGQIDFAMAHTDPLWKAGGGFSYSDTDYIILGEIIERATGKPLPQAVRELAGFDKLGLKQTWWDQFEPAPPAVMRAHQFMGSVDVYDMNPTIDLYGGGGLIGDMADLAHFMRAAVRGDLYEQPTTLTSMLTMPVENAHRYALGVYAVDVGGETCWGHVGFWGTLAFHCPASDITVARSFSQANTPAMDQRLRDVVVALKSAIRARVVNPP